MGFVKLPIEGTSFCNLQIQTDALAVDEDSPGINKLLTAAIVLLVTAQSRKGEEEFHRFRCVAGCAFSRQVDARAEANSIKLRVSFEIAQHRTNEMRDVLIESEGS